jgi:hypothetical protein
MEGFHSVLSAINDQSINQSVVIIIVMEDFNSILFHKDGFVYKQHKYLLINQPIS